MRKKTKKNIEYFHKIDVRQVRSAISTRKLNINEQLNRYRQKINCVKGEKIEKKKKMPAHE